VAIEKVGAVISTMRHREGVRHRACMTSSPQLTYRGKYIHTYIRIQSTAYAGKCSQSRVKTIYFYVSMYKIKICI